MEFQNFNAVHVYLHDFKPYVVELHVTLGMFKGRIVFLLNQYLITGVKFHRGHRGHGRRWTENGLRLQGNPRPFLALGWPQYIYQQTSNLRNIS